MSRITPKTIEWLVQRLGAATGDRNLFATQHPTMKGWTLVQPFGDGLRRHGPYGMPEGYCQPAQFVAHLKQALWAAEQISAAQQARYLETARLRQEFSRVPEIQRIELVAQCVPGPERFEEETSGNA